ncbi:hypothetical protein C8R48DRAFT_702739 [Suillus tomentosus]|nr:hypothetical protein C8R48DRAFT_702739 [Suillus tomentosus]
MRVFMLGFFASLQVRPGVFLTLSAEVAADSLACNSSLWPSCSCVVQQGIQTLKVRLVARQLSLSTRLSQSVT